MRPSATTLSKARTYLSFGIPAFGIPVGILLIMATTLFAGSGIYSFTLNSIDGKPEPLATIRARLSFS